MEVEERVRTKRFTGDPIEFSFARAIDRPFQEEALYNPAMLSIPDFMRSDVAGSHIE